MYQQSGGGKVFLVFVILIILLVIFFVVFGNRISFTKGLHQKLLGDKNIFSIEPKKEQYREVIIPPDNVKSWCQIQELMVGDSREDPIRDRVVGWDSLDNCCIREISGFNCALQYENVIRYCYTGNIGSQITYIMIDGYFGDVSLYKSYIEDLDKFEIENKRCNIEIYPNALIKNI